MIAAWPLSVHGTPRAIPTSCSSATASSPAATLTRKKDKVGPLIQGRLGIGYSVWPICTGGWTNVNEAVYLKRNPDVVKSANFFVWEFMSGGLSRLSDWHTEYAFPRTHPVFASWYAFQRYALPHLIPAHANDLPPTGPIDPAKLNMFTASVAQLSQATASTHPGMFFLYPNKAQLALARQGKEWLAERPALERIAKANNLTLLDISQNPLWN